MATTANLSHLASPVDFGRGSRILHAMSKRHKKQITLSDLGKKLKLTPRAVSQALNGGACTVRISEKTRLRVQALAKEWNYRPNRLAQILRKGSSGMVGILARQQFGYLVQQQLLFARENAERNGLIPSIYLLPDTEAASCQRALDFMLDAKVDGLIVFGDFLRRQDLQRVMDAHLPIVSVGSPNVPHIPKYYADKKEGFALLARHLISRGASSIALMGPEVPPIKKTHWHAWCAIEGTTMAVQGAQEQGKSISLKIHHVPAHPPLPSDKVHPYYSTGYAGMLQIIESGPLPEAVMCLSDSGVHGALLSCAEHGIRVPKDLLITGFENDFSSSAGLLPITSVGQPMEEMLRFAFTDLKSMMDGENALANRATVLPCELIIRQSTTRSPQASAH